LGVLAPAAFAEPTAQVGEKTVAPGGSVTVEVSCDPVGGTPPDTVDAVSQAFEEGTVELRRVTGGDAGSGPAYRGTAKVAPASSFEEDPDAAGEDSEWTVDGTCPSASGEDGKPWSAAFTVAHGTGGSGSGSDSGSDSGSGPGGSGSGSGSAQECPDPHATDCEDESAPGGDSGSAPDGDFDPVPGGDSGSVPGGDSEPVSGDDVVPGGVSESGADGDFASGGDPGSGHACPDGRTTSCEGGAAAVQRGVRAGAGGSFTDSVPALVAGALLIAGACGAAVHRLRLRDAGLHG
jgi:hypothetical protein